MEQLTSLKKQIYAHITDEILNGNLKPGEKINEATLTEKLKVSRTPVREALIELATDGVLENLPRRGFIVKKVTAQEAMKLYDIIGLLDGYIAKTVCPILTESQLKTMDFYLKSINLAIDTETFDQYLTLKEEFHNCYIDLFEYEIYVDSLKKFKSKLIRNNLFSCDIQQVKETLYKINAEHAEILRLFKEKNAEALFDYIKNIHWNPQNAHYDELL